MATPGTAVPGTSVPVASLVSPGGAQGLGGINAYAHTTVQFTVPPLGQTVTVAVDNPAWMVVGQMLVIGTAGGDPSSAACLKLTAINGNTLTLLTVQTGSQILASSTSPGLMQQTSGNTTDFIDGTNNSQNLATAVQPTIWSARLRSWNSVGNPGFEVDQRQVHAPLTNPANGVFVCDRWTVSKGAITGTVDTQAIIAPGGNLIPGTAFRISSAQLNLHLTTVQATLAATDYFMISQVVEGSTFRELASDVHSVSILCSSSVANLSFAVFLRDATAAYSLVKLCTIPTANTLTLIQLPNLPVWTPSGTFNQVPGQVGYSIGICLAAGSSWIAPTAGVWLAGNLVGLAGMNNWLASPVGSYFSLMFIQHEPGSLCSSLQDKGFSQALDESLRYFTKTWSYGVANANAAGFNSAVMAIGSNVNNAPGTFVYPKPMARAPGTISIYNPGGGALNSVYDQTAGVAAVAVTGVQYVSDKGWLQLLASGTLVAGHNYLFHYSADTGW